MDKCKGNSAAGGGAEQEQHCRQQMARAGELCKRLLRRLDVAGASVRRAIDGCRVGLERLEEDRRQRREAEDARRREERREERERLLREAPPPQAKQPPAGKQRTPPQAAPARPPRRALTQILPRQQPQAKHKQLTPPLPAKAAAAARTGARAARDTPARKNEKGKMSSPLLDQKAATKVQPKKPNWKKFVPKPCKKA